MLVITYNRAKNKILRDTLGLPFDLIPESQMEECEQFPLRLTALGSCTYCLDYTTCTECPMNKANNNCTADTGSTWEQYITYCASNNILTHTGEESPAYLPMLELITQYNSELKDIK